MRELRHSAICWSFLSVACLLITWIQPSFAQSGNGQQLFSSRCAGCHGLDGRGGEHGPDIATQPRIRALPDAALLAAIRDGIQGSVMPAFGGSLNAAQLAAVVEHVRFLQGAAKTSSVPPAADVEIGKTLFFGRARCSECHMVGGTGGFIAADLSNFASGRSFADTRERIVNPRNYKSGSNEFIRVLLKGGRTFTGRRRNEDNFSLQLQQIDGSFAFFDKRDISRIEPAPDGIMPDDYGNRLNATELDSLAAFLIRAAGQR